MGLYAVCPHRAVLEVPHMTILTIPATMVGSELAERANFATFVDSMTAEIVAQDNNMQGFEKQVLGTYFGVQATKAFLMHMLDPQVHY